jgi:hypothetical protein
MAKSDGVVIGGNRPVTEEFKQALNRQASGLPPTGAAGSPDTPVVNPDDVLPFITVARAAVGNHVTDLKGTLAAIERELSQPPFGANGQPNAYLVDRHNGLRETAERIRAEIESIGSWSDHQVRLWAKEHGFR